MNGIIFNIVAYLFIAIVSFYRLQTKHKNKFVAIFDFVFSMWAVFFTMYLIKEYHNIINEPLNDKLNWYETITNFLIGTYLLVELLMKKRVLE